MMNDLGFKSSKRFFVMSLVLVFIVGIIDHLLYSSRQDEAKAQLVLEVLKDHKVLTNELHTISHGVQNDLNFIERNILKLIRLPQNTEQYKLKVQALLEFLETHPGYFKVRLVDTQGREIFKIIQNSSHSGYHVSSELHDLSGQVYYQELTHVHGDEFYFSSMEPNIINGVVEQPIRPTVRVSKEMKLGAGHTGHLILNIDGNKIRDLFTDNLGSMVITSEILLLDWNGYYVASYPKMSTEKYSLPKKAFPMSHEGVLEQLTKLKNVQGSLDFETEMFVYSQVKLPNTQEKWFLISKIPANSWETGIKRDLLVWVFWEIIFLSLFLTWLWKDEKKQHEDKVVKVLLKERNEFIQNVSHQLKTPLAIMINSLEKKTPTVDDWKDLKQELEGLVKIVEDMLLLAHVDAIQNLPLKHESIIDIVVNAIDMTGRKAKDKGVTMRFNIEEGYHLFQEQFEIPVMGDLLKSAIVNLLDNAIDFSKPGDLVDLFLSKENTNIVLQIKDNGPGIPKEFIPKLFTRFSRLDGHKRKGTGLGLSIAKKIVELHHGEIVLIQHVGGTAFEIRL